MYSCLNLISIYRHLRQDIQRGLLSPIRCLITGKEQYPLPGSLLLALIR